MVAKKLNKSIRQAEADARVAFFNDLLSWYSVSEVVNGIIDRDPRFIWDAAKWRGEHGDLEEA